MGIERDINVHADDAHSAMTLLKYVDSKCGFDIIK